MGQGAALRLLSERLNATVEKARKIDDFVAYADALEKAGHNVAKVTMSLMGEAMSGELKRNLSRTQPPIYMHSDTWSSPGCG